MNNILLINDMAGYGKVALSSMNLQWCDGEYRCLYASDVQGGRYDRAELY